MTYGELETKLEGLKPNQLAYVAKELGLKDGATFREVSWEIFDRDDDPRLNDGAYE